MLPLFKHLTGMLLSQKATTIRDGRTNKMSNRNSQNTVVNVTVDRRTKLYCLK